MAKPRKDNKGRLLHDGEMQRPDGRYAYRYINQLGQRKTVYSWRLTTSDRTPAGKKQMPALRELELQIDKDKMDGIISDDAALNEYFDRNISLRKIKDTTRNTYKEYYNRYVRDTIGRRPITDLDYSTMLAFFVDLVDNKGYSHGTAQILHGVLNPVFKMALRDNRIRSNPLSGIMSEVGGYKRERKALTADQQEKFINFVAHHDIYKKWSPIISCLFGTGCRIGEMVALRWQDVDFANGFINISIAMNYCKGKDGKYGLHISTPKTEKGIRTIPLLDDVRQILLTERQRQLDNNCSCRTIVEGYGGFIWVNGQGGILTGNNLQHALIRIVEAYNDREREQAAQEHRFAELMPNISPHILRHSFCTRLCENVDDVKLISEIMGHRDINTTLSVYYDVNEKRKKEEFKKLEGKIKIC
ncbi:MAG: site-specific integrase [Oscillospiraceae bacterium]|nr:site-specific integrase [Oscillospiraceae bacterium]